MTFFYKILYSKLFNVIYRSLMYPLRKIIPNRFKIPVTGTIKIQPNSSSKILFYSNETCPMTRHLYWEDEGCTFEYSKIFKKIIVDQNSFFDIGANVGYYSLLAKTLHPNILTYSFEPSKGPNYFLNKNKEMNQFQEMNIEKIALGDVNGETTFFEDINPKYKYLEHHASGTGNTQNTWNNDATNKYNVQIVTLDNFIKERNIESIDLIKMDTEGTEDKVLNGALNTIERFKPIIICEVLENRIEEKIQKIISDIGYFIFKFDDETNQLRKIQNLKLENIDGKNDYFFVHPEKLHVLNEFI
jgi:FkbM family methyltransferase